MFDTDDDPQVDDLIQRYLLGDREAEQLLERFLTKPDYIANPNSVRHVDLSLLFTDIVGSTALFENFGDRYSRAIVSIHDDIVGEAIERSGGKPVKHTGDGIFGSFDSCGRSVKTSLQITNKVKEHNEKFPLLPLNLRIGINVGEVIQEDDDVFGHNVNLASRVCALAGSNTVLTTGIVYLRCKDKGYEFVPRGKYEMKGFVHQIPIFEVT